MEKVDVYSVISDRIVSLLDRGVIPWRRPWSVSVSDPRNLVSGKPYQGINAFTLGATSMAIGYRSAYWLTFNQAKARGGTVRKGEKATPCIFWKTYDTKDTGDGSRKAFVLRYYSVFNVEQCEGVEAPAPATVEEKKPNAPIAACEALLSSYLKHGPELQHGGNAAFYRPISDSIHMPEIAFFDSPEAYHATLFHESIHSTGATKRLDRGLTVCAPFGSNDYGKEELVAEMGAAFLCGRAGIDTSTVENSAAYIQSWLRTIRGDKKLLVNAAAQATKAVKLIAGDVAIETEDE